MKKTINYKKDLAFDDTVSSITSISLECNFSEDDERVDGSFLIEGTYKSHELSLNKKSFKYDLPFREEIANLVKESSKVEIEDFTYELEDNTLKINIDYEITYEEELIEEEFDEEAFNRFLESHEVDIVSHKEEKEPKLEDNLEILDEDTIIQPEDCRNESVEEASEPEVLEPAIKEEAREETLEPVIKEETREINLEPIISNDPVETTILKNIDKEEKYITYHVHVCENDDTFESISKKFNTTTEEIRAYNEFDEIKIGLKLIIPVKDE